MWNFWIICLNYRNTIGCYIYSSLFGLCKVWRRFTWAGFWLCKYNINSADWSFTKNTSFMQSLWWSRRKCYDIFAHFTDKEGVKWTAVTPKMKNPSCFHLVVFSGGVTDGCFAYDKNSFCFHLVISHVKDCWILWGYHFIFRGNSHQESALALICRKDIMVSQL